MARRRIRIRRRRKPQRYAAAALVLSLTGVSAAWYYGAFDRLFEADKPPVIVALKPEPVSPLTSDRPKDPPVELAAIEDMPERGAVPESESAPRSSSTTPKPSAKGVALLDLAARALAEGDLILARAQYTEALREGLSAEDRLEARARLRQLGRETIFTPRIHNDDPFTDHYTIKPGDSLQKIAKQFDVTPELLARINGIADPNRIQAGRRIKIVKGPFHAVVHKSDHVLDVMLGDTLVEYYQVGLGSEDSTPAGRWMVKNKLKNPTYYPPRGGDIVSADDPLNPLGERWIGLEGVGGEALGQMRYGIHGTIEPNSIGRDASLGCIRLYNEDVALLFDLFVVKKSFVDVL